MAEEMYGLTYMPAMGPEGGYAAGPTADVESLMDQVTDPTLAAEIHLLNPDSETTVAYRWLFGTWVEAATGVPPVPNKFFQEPGRKLVLDAWGIEDRKNETLMVTFHVAGMTCESTARPGDYQSVRGYLNLVPESKVKIHLLVHDPAQKVGDDGDLDLFAGLFGQIATRLDMAVVDVANRRLDRTVLNADREAQTGVKVIGRGVVKDNNEIVL